MTPYEFRREIEKSIQSIPGLRISGAGSMVVRPYTADITASIGSDDFIIKIDRFDLLPT